MLLIMFLTIGILLNVIVHVLLIYNEGLRQIENFVFQYLNHVLLWIKILVPSAYIIGKVVCNTAFNQFCID